MSDVAVFWIIWAAVMLTIVWAAICNNRTLAQRQRIIDQRLGKNIGNHDTFLHNNEELKRVSYKAHMWRLICFRDPNCLYKFR